MDRARISVRRRAIAAPIAPTAVRSVPITAAANACRNCGAKVTIRKRVYCDRCFPDQMEAQRRAVTPTFQAGGPAKIAAMRVAGHDPTATPAAQRRRAASASQQRKAVVAWRDDGSLDGVDFRRDILPSLQSLPVREIAETMGSSIITTYLKSANEVAYWEYPKGGAPTQVLADFSSSSLDGLTISVGSTLKTPLPLCMTSRKRGRVAFTSRGRFAGCAERA
jgi:hypothetical protein